MLPAARGACDGGEEGRRGGGAGGVELRSETMTMDESRGHQSRTTAEERGVSTGSGSEILLDDRNLGKHFTTTKGLIIQRQVGAVKAMDGVSLTIHRGETPGLVAESGC